MAETIETFANISAQDLLRSGFRYYGWVRKADSTGIRKMLHMCKYITVEAKTRRIIVQRRHGLEHKRIFSSEQIGLETNVILILS